MNNSVIKNGCCCLSGNCYSTCVHLRWRLSMCRVKLDYEILRLANTQPRFLPKGVQYKDNLVYSDRDVMEGDISTLRPRQNGRHFADDIFKCIFLNENVWISIKMSLKFVPKGPINNIPALVQIMAWRRPGDKPLSEAMMVNLLTHICVSRPQWVTININCMLAFVILWPWPCWTIYDRIYIKHENIFQRNISNPQYIRYGRNMIWRPQEYIRIHFNYFTWILFPNTNTFYHCLQIIIHVIYWPLKKYMFQKHGYGA